MVSHAAEGEPVITGEANTTKTDGTISGHLATAKVLSDWQRIVLLVVNLASLICFGLVAFRLNQANLFYGLDGSEMLVLIKQQVMWGSGVAGFTNNYFQSLGNIWLPVNMNAIPGYIVSLWINGGELDQVIAYIVFSVELFLATYCLSRWLEFGSTIATLAAWGMVLSAMPYWGYGKIYPILILAPHLTTVILATLVALVLFHQVGRAGIISSITCLVGIVLLLGYVAIAQAIFFALVVPILLVFGGGVLAASDSKQERVQKLLGGGIVLGVLGVSGVIMFLYGLHRYTAAYVFKEEFLNLRQTWYDVSIAFQNETWGVVGQLLWIGAISGGVVSVMAGRGLQRTVAMTMLFTMGLLVGFGALTVHVNFWQGPVPLYIEFFLWPFYAVYTVSFLCFVWERLVRWVGNVMERHAAHWRFSLPRGWTVVSALVIAGLPWVILSLTAGKTIAKERDYPYPPKITPIVEVLKNEIGLVPNAPFQGRVATLTGQSIQKPINWIDLHIFDAGLVKQYGNDHRTVGFWFFDIPTLFEYNQFMTPPYYLVMRTFLAKDGDRQMRNIMALRRPDTRLLRALGVRFVITDVPEPGAHLRARVDDGGRPVLYLYELDGVNLGNYSPTNVIRVSSAHEALTQMAREDFDTAKFVVTDEALPVDLVPAASSRISVEKTGLRLTAMSQGTSILVLPFEFSHCLEIKPVEQGMDSPGLFRANLLQVGIIFTGRLDATLTFFAGPFHHAGCRIDDWHDVDRLKIQREVITTPRMVS